MSFIFIAIVTMITITTYIIVTIIAAIMFKAIIADLEVQTSAVARLDS